MKLAHLKAVPFLTTCGLLLSAVFASPASAVIIVDFQDGTIDPGGQTTVDVMIHSDSGSDPFYLFDPIFRVEPISTDPNTKITFVDPMDDIFTSTDSEFVFFGNSTHAESPGLDLFYAYNDNDPNTPLDNPSVKALDETADGFDAPLGFDPVLLVRLTVQHNLNGVTAANTAGDTFRVTLQSEFETGVDIAFENFDLESVEYRVGDPGTITVSAIPEPSTFGLATLATCGLAYRRRRR